MQLALTHIGVIIATISTIGLISEIAATYTHTPLIITFTITLIVGVAIAATHTKDAT